MLPALALTAGAGVIALATFTSPGNSTAPVQACVNNTTNLVRVTSAGSCYPAETQLFLPTENTVPKATVASGTQAGTGPFTVTMSVPAGPYVVDLKPDGPLGTKCGSLDNSNGPVTFIPVGTSGGNPSAFVTVNPGGGTLTAHCTGSTSYRVIMVATPTA